MFSKILIANRGEIAVRIIKTCRRMGIKTVVVYSEADADSMAVEMADESVFIGGAPASESYLVADKIVDAVRATGAEAVHPGFGFLSENAGFARRLVKEGIVFIGPNPHAIEAMGDKIESKKFAVKANISVVPGHVGEIDDTAHAVKISEEIGYPVMLKASAGGGGKGIRVAWNRKDVEEGFSAVRAEAKSSFGDDRIFIEKFIESPRHVEIQVLGDKHGNVVHLFERECSIQRRNQKVIEEAPSPLLDEKTRKAMGDQAVALAKAVQYDSAGTVEFVAGQDKSFFFLEMNTRLQVEHPVTEMITGVDLVEQMIRSAYGEKLPFAQKDLKINGWAMESRIYAEDPYRGFLPSIGRLVRYSPPAEGELPGGGFVRNDAGVREGDEISMFYDPMISKLSTWGKTRDAAIDIMGRALEDFHIEGLGQNIPFLAAVMDQPRFRSGKLSTNYIKDEFPDGFQGLPPTDAQRDLMSAVALAMHRALLARAAPDQLRTDWVVVSGLKKLAMSATAGDGGLNILADGRKLRLEDIQWRPGQPVFRANLDGKDFTVAVKPAAEGFVIRHRATTLHVLVLTPRSAELHEKLPPKKAADTSKMVLSPMPGLVVSIDVLTGQEVKTGEIVAVLEAMKMQNILRAERDGTIKAVNVKSGDSVAADEVLVEFA
ncbi:MAG: acetyl/propionyl/methylcrotonyl-CoA carboxylase subunit alpha [Alphaproteobacteria bacterium]|nr:acetyl/propionyl/methylcrotonyl-CoA carboxylase subunit alpha [Alphaproteobacteria bacterium]MBU1512659.1 acetyl/propionyl/methylcrotonyl-CoA carboxylase subunit alpha [Alphaproteobacteria bacterium]MBU2095053.1 acetyl/propionyl/methylcrotonyl-CoA carboxylase subunit alpha [Alphaproteobacteria bacterium]MBU2151828.1 acetyl/propionyl/methylcrotonyl-CoA carboxylase subunit alpha [Alphaproteobacteria bacterium]MBU2306227.1 acetyl/propionyl/methylcrotonyl-CoA carboxylase subunit alpha [Alphaprot